MPDTNSNEQLQQKLDEYDYLFELQHSRDMEASRRWRAEDPTGRALTLPDRGNLLDYLWGQLIKVEADNDMKTAALLQIVRRRAGNPEFAWMRKFAFQALTEDDHKKTQSWVDNKVSPYG